MIDTDKYEGHTEGPWNNDCSPTNTTTGWYIGSKWGKDDRGLKCIAGMENGNDADAQLIADAPLLLQEVKRLREVNDELQGDLEQFIERVAEDEAGLKDELEATEAEVKRLHEAIADVATNMEAAASFIEDLWKVIE